MPSKEPPQPLEEFLNKKRDYAQKQIESVTSLGVHRIPLDSQMNGYYQGMRDLCVELLARLRDGLLEGHHE